MNNLPNKINYENLPECKEIEIQNIENNELGEKEYAKVNIQPSFSQTPDISTQNESDSSSSQNFFFKNKYIKKINEKLNKFYETKTGRIVHKYILNKVDLILLFINIASIIIYHFSLMQCEGDPTECTIKRGMIFYVTVGVLAVVSCLLFSIYLSFAIFTCKHWLHLLYTIPSYLYYFTNFKGTDSTDHGFYNSLGWVVFMFIFIPLILGCLLIINVIRHKKYKILIITISIILVVIIVFNNLPGFGCEYWSRGLNNTYIDNDKTKYPCHVLEPGKNKCYLNKMNGTFDFSKMFRPSCQAYKVRKDEKKTFLNAIGKQYNSESKLNHFGYPLTTQSKFGMYEVRDLQRYQELVNKGTIKMDLFNNQYYPNEPYPEVELTFDDNGYGNIKINITKNETLSKERKEIAKNKHSFYDNVLIIYIDAISRNHFYRKLGKLAGFIEPFMKYETDETKKEFTAFQFLKYNTVKGLTLPNIKAMFYGINVEEGNGTNFVKYYKDQGYVTGHTGTTCGKEIFSINSLLFTQKLDYNNWDHENIAMFCDPNFFDYRYPIDKGVASVLKRCLYGKYGFEYVMEYTKQFWKLYPDNKKMFRAHFNEGHEGSMELVTYLNDPLYEFVKMFFDNHWLDDTFIFVMSDHGNHMLGPYAILRPRDYVLESTLATLFFIIPNNKKLYDNNRYDIVYENQQIFVTPYDIHDTLIHIAYGDKDTAPKEAYSIRGDSLLKKIDPMVKYCENKDYDLRIAKTDCKCKKY